MQAPCPLASSLSRMPPLALPFERRLHRPRFIQHPTLLAVLEWAMLMSMLAAVFDLVAPARLPIVAEPLFRRCRFLTIRQAPSQAGQLNRHREASVMPPRSAASHSITCRCTACIAASPPRTSSTSTLPLASCMSPCSRSPLINREPLGLARLLRLSITTLTVDAGA